MNPLLERLQNFIQTRRAARQEDQAPTPPAPIPNAGGSRSSSGGGGGGGGAQSIAQIQQQLADAGFDPGPIDGDMGPLTRAAITAFQRARGLQVDGVAGPQTRAALAAPQTPVPPPNANPARPGVIPPRVTGDGAVDRQYTMPTGRTPQGWTAPYTTANADAPARYGPLGAAITQAGMVNNRAMTTMPGSGGLPLSASGAFVRPAPFEEDYSIPIQPRGPTPISGPAPGSMTTGSLTPMAQPGPAANAIQNFGIPMQPRNPAAVPTPSANPTLGPMLAGYDMLPPQAASPGGVLPAVSPPPQQPPNIDIAGILASMPQLDMSAPGWGGGMPPMAPPQGGPGSGGMPVSTNLTTLVGNTGTPFTREDAVNRGFMPAGRDDFGLQNGFFRDLPGFNAQNPPLVTPQTLGQTALRQPVTTTTPTMPNMPLRGMAIPPWWRQFMGAGV